MAKNCWTKFKDTDLHDYLKRVSGSDYNPETGEGRDAFKKAAQELQQQTLNDLNNVFYQAGVPGYKAPVEKAAPVANEQNKPTTAAKEVLGSIEDKKTDIEKRRKSELSEESEAKKRYRQIATDDYTTAHISLPELGQGHSSITATLQQGFKNIESFELTKQELTELEKIQFDSEAKKEFRKKIAQRRLSEINEPINAKYDAELAALEKPNEQNKPTTDETIIQQTDNANQQGQQQTAEGSEPIIEPKKEGEGTRPPAETPKKSLVYFEYPPTQLSHQGTEKIGTEHSFDTENKYERSSILKWNKQADELMDNGFSVNNLLNKVDAGEHIPTPAERVVLTRHAAELQKRLREITDSSTPEFDQTLKELQRVANAANFGGSQTGAALGAIGHIKVIPDGSYAEFMLTELAANNDAPLTDSQKEIANKDFTKSEKANVQFNKNISALEDKAAEDKAYKQIQKVKNKGESKTKKTHEDFVKQRDAARDKIKAAKEAHEKWLKDNGIQQAGASPFVLTKEMIAPIKDLIGSYIEEGVTKLADLTKKVYDEIKDLLPDITEKHIQDIIAGEYNEKRQTKSELAISKENLRIEAQLANKLERLLNGEEPKNEKQKIKRNQEIEDLRKQISDKLKSDNREDAAGNKFYPENKNEEVAKLKALIHKNEEKINDIAQKIFKGDFSVEEKKIPLLENKELQKKYPELFKEARHSADNLIKVKREIALRRLNQMYQNKTPQEKTVEIFSKTLNIPRTLMASFDFSAPLRQGIVATISHPQKANEALKFMFKATVDEKVYNRWLDNVHNDPRWDIAEKTGLGITDPESLHVRRSEEAFQGAPYAEQIPILGAGVKASERAYIGYLNHLRWNLFNMYVDKFEEQGKTFENNPKLYEGISSFINSATGRGNIKGFENAAPILNWFLFASKLIASRLNMLGLTDIPNLAVRGATLGKYGIDYGFYTRLPKEIRIEAAKDMAKFLAVGIATLILANQLGASVESDPRSSDFGKIKVGNTRWDIWGGFQPYARVLTQSLTGERKTTTTGKIQELNGKGFMGQNRLTPVANFARGKLAPIPATVIDLASGHDAAGQPVTIKSELLSDVTPLLFQDVYAAMKDQGVKALFTVGIPSAFGVGVQTYETKKHKQ